MSTAIHDDPRLGRAWRILGVESDTPTAMHCHVYASTRKTETYIWLDDPQRLDDLPDDLRALLGEVRFVLALDLQPERVLPNQETVQVLDNLGSRGWHLQLPPGESPD